jgi:hypothetical protein
MSQSRNPGAAGTGVPPGPGQETCLYGTESDQVAGGRQRTKSRLKAAAAFGKRPVISRIGAPGMSTSK